MALPNDMDKKKSNSNTGTNGLGVAAASAVNNIGSNNGTNGLGVAAASAAANTQRPTNTGTNGLGVAAASAANNTRPNTGTNGLGVAAASAAANTGSNIGSNTGTNGLGVAAAQAEEVQALNYQDMIKKNITNMEAAANTSAGQLPGYLPDHHKKQQIDAVAAIYDEQMRINNDLKSTPEERKAINDKVHAMETFFTDVAKNMGSGQPASSAAATMSEQAGQSSQPATMGGATTAPANETMMGAATQSTRNTWMQGPSATQADSLAATPGSVIQPQNQPQTQQNTNAYIYKPANLNQAVAAVNALDAVDEISKMQTPDNPFDAPEEKAKITNTIAINTSSPTVQVNTVAPTYEQAVAQMQEARRNGNANVEFVTASGGKVTVPATGNLDPQTYFWINNTGSGAVSPNDPVQPALTAQQIAAQHTAVPSSVPTQTPVVTTQQAYDHVVQATVQQAKTEAASMTAEQKAASDAKQIEHFNSFVATASESDKAQLKAFFESVQKAQNQQGTATNAVPPAVNTSGSTQTNQSAMIPPIQANVTQRPNNQ